MIGRLAAAALSAICAPRARAFERALDDPVRAQRATLARILRVSAASALGRSLGLATQDDPAAFRAKVPLMDYRDLAPWIERQRAGERDAIVVAPVVCYEKTSGSSSAIKRIPYTGELIASFRSLFRLWAHDLLRHRLRPQSARLFMSVSPRPREAAAGGTPVGLEHDAEYLGAGLRALIGRFLVVAPGTRLPQAPDDLRDVLSCLLAAEESLEILSVWSPTYLLVLLEHFAAHRDTLLPALRMGRIERGTTYRFPPLGAARLALLAHDPIDWQCVWSDLQLLSCWASAASTAPARRLHGLLPRVFLQPKGLLATEAPVSVPWTAAKGCVPLVDEVLLEFLDGARARWLHELEDGAEYEVLVSQCGGLLRYRLGDRVRVSGRYRGVPLLEFLGRDDAVSDLVGEKLHEDFIAAQLDALGCGERLALLLPMADGAPHYRLLIEGEQTPDALAFDTALQGAHHYRIARQLGQLEAARTQAVPELGARVHRFFIERGQAAGDIKDRRLVSSAELASALYRALARSADA